MACNLILVSRNPEPKRERSQPDLWLIHTQGERPVEVHRSRDRHNAPEWVQLDALDRSSLTKLVASKRALD